MIRETRRSPSRSRAVRGRVAYTRTLRHPLPVYAGDSLAGVSVGHYAATPRTQLPRPIQVSGSCAVRWDGEGRCPRPVVIVPLELHGPCHRPWCVFVSPQGGRARREIGVWPSKPQGHGRQSPCRIASSVEPQFGHCWEVHASDRTSTVIVYSSAVHASRGSSIGTPGSRASSRSLRPITTFLIRPLGPRRTPSKRLLRVVGP